MFLKMATEEMGEHVVCALHHHTVLRGEEKGEC